MKLPMRALAIPTVFLVAGAAQPARSEAQQIEGVALSRDIVCDGGEVGIYGANNNVRLAGPCGDVVVHGLGHTVVLEKAARLAVTGAQQKVTGGSVSGLTIDGSQSVVSAVVQPTQADALVEVAGSEHNVKLQLAGPSRISAQGYKHDIVWTASTGTAKPKLTISGIQTTIAEKKP